MPNSPIESCANCPLWPAIRGRCPFTQIQLRAGAVLIAQGEPWDRTYLVRQGILSLSKVAADGRESSFSVRGPRSFLGAEAIAGRSSEAEAVAITDVKLCVATQPQLAAWIGPEDSPARVVLALALGEMDQRQADQHWRSGECLTRVAKLALACPDSREPSEPPVEQKQQMARLLGMRPETFSRCLRKLTDGGLLDRSLHVRNRPALEQLSEA